MNPNDTIQPQNESIDPTVLALTKAIGQAESGGNYEAIGDGGNSQGAFQMTPGFLQEWAPKAGIQYQPGKQLSMEEQNRIAYNAIKTMGTTGDPSHPEYGKLSPSQIASKWNTGDPNMYAEDPSYGKNNAYGSIGGYVDKVKENYENNLGIKQQSTPQQPQNVNQPNWMNSGVVGGINQFLAPEPGTHPLIPPRALMTAAIPAAAGAVVATGGLTGILPAIAEGLGFKEVIDLFTGSGSKNAGQTIIQNVGGSPNNPSQPGGALNIGNQTSPNKIAQQDASQEIANAVMGMMQNTQSGRNYSGSEPGQAAIGTASAFGLIHPDENGALTFDEQKRQSLLGKVGNLLDKTIEANDSGASPLSVRNYAGTYIGNDRYATASERQAAARIATKELEAQKIPINGEMSLSAMRKAQKEHYSAAERGYREGRTTPEILAHKALGNAYGRVIRDNLPDKELYDRTKKMESALINTKEVGKKIQGKMPPKNRGIMKDLMHSGSRWAAVYIGDKIGGPIGAILGDMVGIHLSRAVDKKYGRTTFETPAMQKALAILEDGEPEAYRILVGELKKHGVSVPETSAETEEELDTPKEVKEEIEGLKRTIPNKIESQVTSDLSRNPKQTQGLSPRKPKGKDLKGLIQSRKSPPNNQ